VGIRERGEEQRQEAEELGTAVRNHSSSPRLRSWARRERSRGFSDEGRFSFVFPFASLAISLCAFSFLGQVCVEGKGELATQHAVFARTADGKRTLFTPP